MLFASLASSVNGGSSVCSSFDWNLLMKDISRVDLDKTANEEIAWFVKFAFFEKGFDSSKPGCTL